MREAEVESFQGIWEGGYFEGDPLDPHARSAYSAHDIRHGYADQLAIADQNGIKARELGFISSIHAAYLMCLKGRVQGKAVLEIGPGRGAWSRCILKQMASELYTLDALTAEHNGFYDYIGQDGILWNNVHYLQVDDFSCKGVPKNAIDFFFSFGCFCHISRTATTEYFKAIYTKMHPGAEGFVMISDYGKVATALGNETEIPDDLAFREDETPSPGRWYHLGTEWFCKMLTDIGFQVINRDVGCNIRDPIVYFIR